LNNMQERLEKMMPVAETVSRKNEKWGLLLSNFER
jgi:hypothetical protein